MLISILYPTKHSNTLPKFKAYCVGGSMCRAHWLYAVKLTETREIFISPRMWLGQNEYCPAAHAP